MECRKRLSEEYDYQWITDTDNYTIFRLLASNTDLNDFINDSNSDTLDADYYMGNSGDKFLSPIHERLLSQLPTKNDAMKTLGNIVYTRFGEKWKNIYNALTTEYNPLENYSMEEIRTPDLTTDETQNEKTDITVERETEASNSYKGFNAAEPALVNKTEGDETTTTTGAKADNEVSKKIEETGTETKTRSGNIGVTTSQQMLESEFKVRQYDFYKQVYADIDSVLCLSIY